MFELDFVLSKKFWLITSSLIRSNLVFAEFLSFRVENLLLESFPEIYDWLKVAL